MGNPTFLRERWAPPLLFLTAFGFALLGLNPTFYADDSAETITACATLGIPHPPGYPLFTLLGSLFAGLPLSGPSLRVNLFSAALGASVCLLLFLFLRRRLGVSTWFAVLFSLLWMAGTTTYPAALSAKTGIYQMTAFFLLAIPWALLEGLFPLAAFLFGLSLCNHWMTMMTFLPGFGILVLGVIARPSADRRDLGRRNLSNKPVATKQTLNEIPTSPITPIGVAPRNDGKTVLTSSQVVISFALLILGLSTYLYLPLRARMNPSLDWGNPSTLHEFVFGFLRSQYGNPVEGGSLADRLGQLGMTLKGAVLEFWVLFPLALWGLKGIYSKDKPLAQGMGLLWMGLTLAVGFLLRVAPDFRFMIPLYLIPSQALVLCFSALGLETFLAAKDELHRKKVEKICVSVLVLLLGTLGVLRWTQDRQTDYTYDYDFALNGLKGVPRNALYFCKGDPTVFPCWYFQWVEGRRPDVAVIGVDGLPMEWIRQDLAFSHPGLKVPKTVGPVGNEAVAPLAQWMADQNPLRDLYLSFDNTKYGFLMGVKPVPYGLGEKGFRPGEEPVLDEAKAYALWDGLRLRHLQDPRFTVDGKTQNRLLPDYGIWRNNLGVYDEDLGDEAAPKPGQPQRPEDFLRSQYFYGECVKNFKWAAQWAPQNPQFAYNLGNAWYHIGHSSEAMDCFAKATQLNPRYTEAYFNWAATALNTGDYAKAKELFSKVLELDPNHAEAKRGLDVLKQKGM